MAEPKKGDQFFWEGMWFVVLKVTKNTMRCQSSDRGLEVTFHDKARALRSGWLKFGGNNAD